MRLRRISGYVGEQNWFAVGLDLVTVFLAVFVGLQADNWNQERIARNNASTYYARLVEDLEVEQTTRQERVAYYERTKRHAESALAALPSASGSADPAFLIDVYQSTQYWNYLPHRTTYDELIGSGIANAIPNVEIRGRLAKLYVNLNQSNITQQEPMPFRTELRRHMPYEVQRIIRAKCGDRYRFLDDGMMLLTLPETCNAEFDPATVGDALVALRNYEDLEKDLVHHVSILDTKLGSLRAYDKIIQQMIDLLAEQ